MSRGTHSSYGHEDVHRSCSHGDVLDVILLDPCRGINVVCIIVNLRRERERETCIMVKELEDRMKTQGRGCCGWKRLSSKPWKTICSSFGHQCVEDGDNWTGTSYRVDPRQLLAHVHDDDGDQLPAKRALGEQGEHGQVALGSLRLVLQTHLGQLCVHIVQTTQSL